MPRRGTCKARRESGCCCCGWRGGGRGGGGSSGCRIRRSGRKIVTSFLAEDLRFPRGGAQGSVEQLAQDHDTEKDFRRVGEAPLEKSVSVEDPDDDVRVQQVSTSHSDPLARN